MFKQGGENSPGLHMRPAHKACIQGSRRVLGVKGSQHRTPALDSLSSLALPGYKDPLIVKGLFYLS